MTATLTKNEIALLVAIAHDETNAAKGDPQSATTRADLSVWSHVDEWALEIKASVKATKALLKSLDKKGMIAMDVTGEASALDFTDEGFAVIMRAIVPTLPDTKIGPTEAVREFLRLNPQASVEEAVDALGSIYNTATVRTQMHRQKKLFAAH